MIKSFTIYSPKNFFRLLSALLLLATILASGQAHTLNLTTSGTYTVPQGVTALTVEVWGGGGGGGRATSNGQTTGGGGGGAFSSSVINVAANSSISYFVGLGGLSGDNDGKDSWFKNSTTVLAKGGKGVGNNITKGASGGQASESVGSDRHSGGNGGSGSGSQGYDASGGGGGAAKIDGVGENGVNGAPLNNGGDGGLSTNPGGNGGAGADRGASTPGSGLIYGGGGGGAKKALLFGNDKDGGSGAQGLIRLRFTKPSININPSSITICRGSDVSLTASSAGAYSYAWSNGAGTGASVTVSPTNTTTYTVTGTASNGAGGTFTHTQTVTVTVVDPVANIAFTQAPFPIGATACNLQYMKIDTNVSVIYTPTTGLYTNSALTVPYTGSSVSVIYAAPNGSQIYTATATNGTCSKTNTVSVTRTPSTPMLITQVNSPTGVDTCSRDYVQLTTNQSASFSPVVGLYTDATLTNPYTGGGVTTVFAFPDGSQVYTATGVAGSCSVLATVTVANYKKVFIGIASGAAWEVDENWRPAIIPSINRCVYIPTGKSARIGSSDVAHAKRVIVESGAGLTIDSNADLSLSERLTNQDPSGDNVVIESDGILLQTTNTANQGSITMKRKVHLSAERKQYNYLISPVNGQKMKYIFGTTVTGAPYVQYVLRLNEPTNLFVNDGDGIYVKGKGYSVKEPNSAYTGDEAIFKGVPANGDFDYPLSYSATNRGYNLTGNPYPSNMDIYELYQESKNPDDDSYYIDSNIRFWDSEANNIFQQYGGDYQGYAYAVFNAGSGSHGTGTPAPGGNEMPATGKTPNHIVKTGQGFLVRANGENMKLLFRNGAQRTLDQSGSIFFGKNKKLIEDDRFWLEYSTASGLTISNAIVYFDAGKNEFALDDTKIPNSSASDALFTYAGDTKVIINGRPAFNKEDVIALGISNYTAGTNVFKLGNKEGVFKNGQSIYLKDKELGILTDLTAGDYVFTSEAGEFTNRFEIVYENGLVLSTDTPKNSPINIFRDANDFVVKSSDKMIKNIEIFDASGRMIRTISGKSKELRFESGQFIAGIYILKVALQGGETFTKKIRK